MAAVPITSTDNGPVNGLKLIDEAMLYRKDILPGVTPCFGSIYQLEGAPTLVSVDSRLCGAFLLWTASCPHLQSPSTAPQLEIRLRSEGEISRISFASSASCRISRTRPEEVRWGLDSSDLHELGGEALMRDICWIVMLDWSPVHALKIADTATEDSCSSNLQESCFVAGL